MKILNKILLKYANFREKRKIAKEKTWKIFFLTNFGAYNNADELTHEEMLNVFWKVLEKRGYNVSELDSNTSISEPTEHWNWGDFGGEEFIFYVEKMFDLSDKDIGDNQYIVQAKTFGELADLVIRKAREKKLKQNG